MTPPSAPTDVRITGSFGCPEFLVGWTRSTDDVDPQFAIEYELEVNGVISPLPVSAGVDVDFVDANCSERAPSPSRRWIGPATPRRRATG